MKAAATKPFRGIRAALLAGCAAAAIGTTTVTVADAPSDGTSPRIAWSVAVPRVEVSTGVALGGLSDLAPAGDGTRFWTLTDRGPNGSVMVGSTRVRTLAHPDFVPTLVLVRIDETNREDGPARRVTVERSVPLATPRGTPLSGRPPVDGRDGPMVHAADGTVVAVDPDGVDPEGIVPLADGTFWIADEYAPSLLRVAADGRVLERHVPGGMRLANAECSVRDTLPAVYATRRENRGFEALTASGDGSRLWALLQSPLANPRPKAAARTGNVRLLGFDPRVGRPVAEHIYRLGDPDAAGFLTAGAAPDDGKLCAMAAVVNDALLVLEQDDGGGAVLYLARLAGATNTLEWSPAADGAALEQVGDLGAAGIAPVRKTRVADLGGLRRRMALEADGGTATGVALKLEGLAVVDPRHVLLVDDDDFGVRGHDGPGRSGTDPPRQTRLWLVELAEPLPEP